MKTTSLAAITAASALLLTGCESDGLSAREQHNNYVSLINSVYQRPLPEKTNAPLIAPIKLAVGQIGEVAPEATLLTALSSRPALVQQVIPIPLPGAIVTTYGIKNEKSATDMDKLANEIDTARDLARDAGARYLLVVGGNIDSVASQNLLTPLNVTVVGLWIVPAVSVKSDGKAAGALIDVESGRVLVLVSAQGKDSSLTPEAYVDDTRQNVNSELRKDVLKKLGDNFLTTLAQQSATNLAAR